MAGIIRWDRSFKVADALTILTLLIGIITYGCTSGKDRRLQETGQADKVRAATNRLVGKVDRWRELSLSLCDEIVPTFVKVEQHLSNKKPTGPWDQPQIHSAVSILFDGLYSVKTSQSRKMHDEGFFLLILSFIPTIGKSVLNIGRRSKN